MLNKFEYLIKNKIKNTVIKKKKKLKQQPSFIPFIEKCYSLSFVQIN